MNSTLNDEVFEKMETKSKLLLNNQEEALEVSGVDNEKVGLKKSDTHGTDRTQEGLGKAERNILGELNRRAFG